MGNIQNEVQKLDAREALFVESEASTVAAIVTGFRTGEDGYLTGWAGMALLLYRSHENLSTALIKGAGEKKAKVGLPVGYISRLAEYLARKLDIPMTTARPYLSALNGLVEKGGKNTDATLRALCSNSDAQKIVEHWKSKGMRSWASIAAHARRNSEGGGNTEPKSKRLARTLKEQKPTDIVEALLSLPNVSVIFDKLAKAMAKAPRAKRK